MYKRQLEAALNQRYEDRQIEAPGQADETGIAEVVRLLLREELTGAAPPQSLSMVMDLWRPWVESRAGELFRELGDSLEDQATFAEISRRLIGALETDLGDASNDQDDSEDDSDQSEDNGDQQNETGGEQSSVGEDQSEGDDSQTMEDTGDGGASEDGEMVEADGADEGMSDGDSPHSDMRGHNQDRGQAKDAYRLSLIHI